MSSPTSTTSTNKRKADALSPSYPLDGDGGDAVGGGRPAVIARLKDATSVSDPSPTTTPHIPAPVWGHVLDFMPYEEVRSALLVGKIIANEAVKYVRTLNFMKSCQLDVPSARRFENAEEVNCLCLISGQLASTVLSSDTTIRLVPLLTAFSELKRIYVGGLVTKNVRNGEGQHFVRHQYYSTQCSSPENHREIAKAFYNSFLGAFKARLLPPALDEAKGILFPLFRDLRFCSRTAEGETDSTGRGMCASCRDVCSYFPLQIVAYDPLFSLCSSEIEVYEMISKRKGAREIFREQAGEYLPNLLDIAFHFHPIGNAESKEEEALSRRLTDFGIRCEYKEIRYLTMSDITYLDRLIAVGYDPRSVSKAALYREIGIGRDHREYDIFAKSTIDALVAREFALDEADLIVLDERMEPALKDLSALIRGEYELTSIYKLGKK